MSRLDEVLKDSGQHLAIALHHNTPHDAATVLEICITAANLGRKISILDLTRVTPRGAIYFPENLIRNYLWSSPYSPLERLKQISQPLGFNFIIADNFLAEEGKGVLANLLNHVPETLDELVAWDQYSGYLGPSLASYLTSLVSPDEELKPQQYKSQLITALSSFLIAKEFMDKTLTSLNIDELSVFNGRFPSMAAISMVAEQRGVQRYWHEIGRTPAYIFFERFRPHDRVEMQTAMQEFQQEFDDKQLQGLFDEFVFERGTNEKLNPFLKYQGSSQYFSPKIDSKLATVFTSSPDETVGIGQHWSDIEWSNQYEALGKAVTQLHDNGFRVLVRLHPNLVTKSWGEFMRAVRFFRELPCEVVLPTDNIKSYDLLNFTQICIVWRSTIGLEACARGIPTFCLGRNRYDMTANVKLLLSRQALEEESFSSFPIDTRSCIPGILSQKYAARRSTTSNYNDFIREFDAWTSLEAKLLVLNRLFLPLSLLPKMASSPRYFFRMLLFVLPRSWVTFILRNFFRLPTLSHYQRP
jgi:hypothetical protein